jgi:hypothetical protein
MELISRTFSKFQQKMSSKPTTSLKADQQQIAANESEKNEQVTISS